jgi:signal transduction histidine kinase
MSIRTRLTLWYAGALFVSLLLLAGLSYHELVIERLAERGDVPPAEQAREEFGDEVRILFTVGLPAFLLSLGVGWFLTRKALSPVARLTEAAARLQAGNLHERLARSGSGDELDRLTGVFNDMTARLDRSFQHIREFTLHASHELKTPLTVMRGEFETALREEQLTEAQRERLFSQLDEVQRLAQIVDGLTLLTKADAGQVMLKQESVAFDELVRDSVEDAQTLGDPRGLRVSLTADGPLTVRGDRHRLRQLLLNLADNAVKYCQPGGKVTFALNRVGSAAELVVTNTGPGLAAELQPRVFERFFRGDASHGHETDGCGLGLSIAQWIARAHGGTIQFVSEPDARTSVTVRLPLTASEDRPAEA